MKIIGHIDMDAFFAAVEERDNPRLKGLPIVVGSAPAPKQVLVRGRPNGGKTWIATGRGVVSTANYKAREYGIRSATPITKAWRFSQEAKKKGKSEVVFLPVNFRKYEKSSAVIMEILQKFSPVVEQAGIDEAYFDLGFAGSYEKAENVCEKIKKEIYKKERLTCSVGIGPNKLVAKIASDFKKPDGLTVVREKDAEKFLENMPIRKIPGIGPKTESMFLKMGVRLGKDLKKITQGDLYAMMGKWGLDLYEKARGRDNSELVTEYEAKSIGEQETFLKDTLEAEFIFGEMKKLCADVFRRFKASDFKSFKTVGIVVRFADFQTLTRVHTLKELSASQKTLEFEALKLLMPFLDKRENPKHKKVRLIGVKVEKLV